MSNLSTSQIPVSLTLQFNSFGGQVQISTQENIVISIDTDELNISTAANIEQMQLSSTTFNITFPTTGTSTTISFGAIVDSSKGEGAMLVSALGGVTGTIVGSSTYSQGATQLPFGIWQIPYQNP